LVEFKGGEVEGWLGGGGVPIPSQLGLWDCSSISCELWGTTIFIAACCLCSYNVKSEAYKHTSEWAYI